MCGMILNLLNICGMISNFLIKSGSGSCPHILHLKCSLRNSIHTYLIANTLATLFTSDSMYVCTYVCAHHARARAHTHTHTHTESNPVMTSLYATPRLYCHSAAPVTSALLTIPWYTSEQHLFITTHYSVPFIIFWVCLYTDESGK